MNIDLLNTDLLLLRILIKSPSLFDLMTKINEFEISEQNAAERSESFQIATNLLLSFKYADKESVMRFGRRVTFGFI